MRSGLSLIRILFVEDSKFYSEVIKSKLGPMDHVILDTAETHEDGLQFLNNAEHPYDLALVDLNLPDAPTAAFAREARKRNISTIVFSGILDHKLKEELFGLGIIDYVAKDSPVALEHLQELIEFLMQQSVENVLVVNKECHLRNEQVRMLENLKMSAWACSNKDEALKLAQHRKNFSLALIGEDIACGQSMALVTALRKLYKPAELAIIAIPSQETNSAAQYLRVGANDFLRQPYSSEEFQCRIRNAVKMQNQLGFLQEAATRDFLTQLLNRRAFFEASKPIFANAKRTNTPLSIAMFDIDHFKKVNDNYGHSAGDQVIHAVAKALSSEARDADVLARFGGEEFCLLMPHIEKKNIPPVFERYRKAVNDLVVSSGGRSISITTSVGITSQPHTSLEAMIKSADKALYEAKESGRDQFVLY